MPVSKIETAKGAKFAKVGGLASAHARPAVFSFATFAVKYHIRQLGLAGV